MLLCERDLDHHEHNPNLCRGATDWHFRSGHLALDVIPYATLTATPPFWRRRNYHGKKLLMTGTYEDPEWLSSSASQPLLRPSINTYIPPAVCSLIRSILLRLPARRTTNALLDHDLLATRRAFAPTRTPMLCRSPKPSPRTI